MCKRAHPDDVMESVPAAVEGDRQEVLERLHVRSLRRWGEAHTTEEELRAQQRASALSCQGPQVMSEDRHSFCS